MPAYALKLSLWVRRINVGAQKINGSTFEIFEMVLVSFQAEDKLRRACFFQETFLLADTSIEVVLGMLFLTFSIADIQLDKKKFTWRTYTTAKVLPTTKQV